MQFLYTFNMSKEIGKILLKGIKENKWIEIKYHNKEDCDTNFLIGINNINEKYENEIICDQFNITKGIKILKNTYIKFANIIDAEIREETYHFTPSKLLDDIYKHNLYNHIFQPRSEKDDLIDYFIDSLKLDRTPFLSNKYILVEGIDQEVLENNEYYQLSDKQFIEYFKNLEKNKKRRQKNELNLQTELVINILSMVRENKIYLLAYKKLFLDIEKKQLRIGDDLLFNSEFIIDPNSEVKDTLLLSKFLPEDKMILLEDPKKNFEKIKNAIYENNVFTPYAKSYKVDTTPKIMNLGRQYNIKIEDELKSILDILHNNQEDDLYVPIRSFFGETFNHNLGKSYPIFTIDDKHNIDEINAINKALCSTVSYIAGPPGTGKTSTIVNAIISSYMNDKTVLICSNNNKPLDDIYLKINSLKYKSSADNIYPLLFPILRLGSKEYLISALDKIKENYYYVINNNLKNNNKLDFIKKKCKDKLNGLVKALTTYDSYKRLKNEEKYLKEFIKRFDLDEFEKIRYKDLLDTTINEKNNLKQYLKNEDGELSNYKDYLNIDFNSLFTFINFDSVRRIRLLDTNNYIELKEIILGDKFKSKDEQLKEFKHYLSDNDNLILFLKIFPIIMSTNLSSIYLGKINPTFDIVMMDEASQCNLSSSLLSIVRGKQLTLVGDVNQLKPVTLVNPTFNNVLKKKYIVSDEYDYCSNSIYDTYSLINPLSDETLLSYHYRCAPKIINFSNKKYYGSNLKIETKEEKEDSLLLIDTKDEDNKNSNLNKKNVSTIEGQVIIDYIKKHKDENIGIITPFINQKEYISSILADNKIPPSIVGTVHGFQGDEKETIIFSTTISNQTSNETYNWVKNNKELINVAVTRAKKKFILLGNTSAVNKNSKESNDDLKDLFDYVKTNGQSNVKLNLINNSNNKFGIKEIDTLSEKDFGECINHILSVINDNDNCLCYTSRQQVQVNKILKYCDASEKSIFYNGSFDMVILKKTNYGEIPILAVELNGPEHEENEEVIKRDNLKKSICKKNNLELISIKRKYAKDYIYIKDIIKSLFDKKGNKRKFF